MPEVAIVASLVFAAAAYAYAIQREWQMSRESEWPETLAFMAGLAVVAAALVSPIDTVAHRSLWVHMVQHVLLISVAAPLLALGQPLVHACRFFGRTPPRLGRRAWLIVAAAAVAQVITLLVWHVPAMYEAALAHDPIHGLEHLSLLLTAVGLWLVLGTLDGERAGGTVIALFIASFPPMILGVGMTFAGSVWYQSYVTPGHDALLDQQLAGVVMWGYGSLAAVAGGVYLFVHWLHEIESATPGRPPGAGEPDALTGVPSC